MVAKRGSWLSFESEQIGQGALAATEFLRTHPEVTQTIIDRVLEHREAFMPGRTPRTPAAAETAEEESGDAN